MNAETSAIVICAGEGTRWGNHGGVPKHLVFIEGERILDRTVRMLRERGIGKIWVVVKEISDAYVSEGSVQAVAKLEPEKWGDADKFLSSSFLWNVEGRTLVLYGDCYFSEGAMDAIVGFERREWTLFCRPGASKVTGTPWGECFSQSFWPEHLEKHREALEYVGRLHAEGTIRRCGGWEHYGAMVGRKGKDVMRSHLKMTSNFVEIDDWTDDFDYPSDLENWTKRRAKFRAAKEN